MIGDDCVAVTTDGSPHGERTVALWEPGFTPASHGENGAPVRRSAGGRRRPHPRRPRGRGCPDAVLRPQPPRCGDRRDQRATPPRDGGSRARRPRGRVPRGYLADDRRALEAALSDGTLLGVATTNALELGVDIAGLGRRRRRGLPGHRRLVLAAGGTGRASRGGFARGDGRPGRPARHLPGAPPEALLGRPVEAGVFDPANPYVLGPHLLCAATEAPLTDDDVAAFGAGAVVADLTERGMLRRRARGWYPAAGLEPHADVDIRGGIGGQVMIVDTTTSQLLGTVDTGRAMSTVHAGAVHLHRGGRSSSTSSTSRRVWRCVTPRSPIGRPRRGRRRRPTSPGCWSRSTPVRCVSRSWRST